VEVDRFDPVAAALALQAFHPLTVVAALPRETFAEYKQVMTQASGGPGVVDVGQLQSELIKRFHAQVSAGEKVPAM
jgi:hypothetical protein